MIAISVLLSWQIIALAVVGLILFYKVIDLAVDAATQLWRDADAEGVEDLPANRERER
jgi:hypothetical protein